MAHRRKELGLDHGGAQSRVACVGGPSLGGLTVGDVVDEGDKELTLARLKRIDRRLEGELAPVAAPALFPRSGARGGGWDRRAGA